MLGSQRVEVLGVGMNLADAEADAAAAAAAAAGETRKALLAGGSDRGGLQQVTFVLQTDALLLQQAGFSIEK